MNPGVEIGEEIRRMPIGLRILLSGEEIPYERSIKSRVICSYDDIRFLSAESTLECILDLPIKTLILPDGPLDIESVRKIIKDKIEKEKSIGGFREIVLDSSGGFGELKSSLHPLRVESMSTLSSARANYFVSRGKWMYEVELETAGVQQIGWVTCRSEFTDSKGVGDGADSYAFDGNWVRKWNGESKGYGQPWMVGDIIGCCIDLEEDKISFYRNGVTLGTAFSGIQRSSGERMKFYPAISLYQGEKCNLNFGGRPFRYPVENFLPIQPPPLQLGHTNRLLQHLSRLLDLHNSERLRRDKRYSLIGSLFHPISHGICAEYLDEIEAEGVLEYTAESSFLPFLLEQFSPQPPHRHGSLERVMDLFLEFPNSRPLFLRLILALAARCRTAALVLLECPFSGSYPFLSLATQILRREELVSLWCSSPEFGFSLEGFLSIKTPNKHDIKKLLPFSSEADHFDTSIVLASSTISGAFDKIEELHRELCRIVIEFIPPLNPDAARGSVFRMFLRNVIEAARVKENKTSSMLSLYMVILHFLSEGSTPRGVSEKSVALLRRTGRRSLPLRLLWNFDPVRTTIPRLGGLYSHLTTFLEREEIVWEKGCPEEEEDKVTHSGRKPCCCCFPESDLGRMKIATNPNDSQEREEPDSGCAHVSEGSSGNVANLNDAIVEKPEGDGDMGSLPRCWSLQKTNKLLCPNPFSEALGEEELLDAVLFLYRLGVSSNFNQAFYYKTRREMLGTTFEKVERHMRRNVSSQNRRALKEEWKRGRKKLLECARQCAWFRISLFSRWKQQGTYALCVWVAEMLLVLTRDDELFLRIPEFYLETLVSCMMLLCRSSPQFVSPSILNKQGLSPYVMLAATHFNDSRIVNQGLKERLLKSTSILIREKEFLSVFESNKAVLEKMSRALLTSFDQRSRFLVSDVLDHLCRGSCFGLSKRRVSTSSSLFQALLRDSCLADRQLLSSFLNELFNALNTEMTEFFILIQGAKDGDQVSDSQLRECSSIFDLSCGLARILEFFTLSIPKCFLQESNANLCRLMETIVFVFNHLVSGPDSKYFLQLGHYRKKMKRGKMLGPIVGIIANLVDAMDSKADDFVGMFASMDSPAIQFGLQYLMEYDWGDGACQARLALLEQFVSSLKSKKKELDGEVECESESESDQCCICYESKVDTLLKPCSHRSCFGCITRHLLNGERCFFCNATVEEVSKIDEDPNA